MKILRKNVLFPSFNLLLVEASLTTLRADRTLIVRPADEANQDQTNPDNDPNGWCFERLAGTAGEVIDLTGDFAGFANKDLWLYGAVFPTGLEAFVFSPTEAFYYYNRDGKF